MQSFPSEKKMSICDDGSGKDNEERKIERYESVPIIINEDNFIYYVISNDGYCSIKEISPKNDCTHHHKTVCQIKSQSCYSFSRNFDSFYFIDDKKNIIKL